MDFFLPCNYLIHYLTLFGSGATKIDACCLDALMSHKVSEKSQVVELVKEVLGKAMTKGMRINHFTIKTILVCKML